MRIVLLILATLTLAGCMHTVRFDNAGGAHWTATPYTDATGVGR